MNHLAHRRPSTSSTWRSSPPDLTVPVGSRITWTNQGAIAHTATSNGTAFDSGSLAPGQEFSVTPDQIGTFTYFCRFHSTMQATITVTP